MVLSLVLVLVLALVQGQGYRTTGIKGHIKETAAAVLSSKLQTAGGLAATPQIICRSSSPTFHTLSCPHTHANRR